MERRQTSLRILPLGGSRHTGQRKEYAEKLEEGVRSPSRADQRLFLSQRQLVRTKITTSNVKTAYKTSRNTKNQGNMTPSKDPSNFPVTKRCHRHGDL